MSASLPPLIRRGWAAVLAAAAVAASPAAAAAGCGDHVVVHPSEATAPPAPPPCHDPACSGSPDHDPLPPASDTPIGSARDAVLAVGRADPAGPAGWLGGGPPDPTPDPPAARPFHPPRLRA